MAQYLLYIRWKFEINVIIYINMGRRRMKKVLLVALLTAVLSVVSSNAHALIILEVENNDSIAGAQNINNFFSLGANADIANATTIPWVSIIGTGNGTWDFYSFNIANADTLGVFDIDYGRDAGGSFDPWLELYTGAGAGLASNDDSSISNGAGGSVHIYDSFLTYTFQPGNYAIAVGRYSGYEVPAGATYTLQTSLAGHSTQSNVVPEPATMALFGLGSVGMAFMRRKKVI